LLFLRTLVFYIGYVVITVSLSTVFLLAAPVAGDRGRYAIACGWCGAVLGWLRFSCGVRYKLRGLENLQALPAVIVSNHQSSWETIFYYRLAYPVSPILKKELISIPFWGWSLRYLHPIAIDRSKPREAGKSLLKQGLQRLQQGSSIIVFPEGSRSSGLTLGRFSRGAAKLAISAGAPIIPIAHDAGKCWPPRQLLKRPGTINVVIGQPIESKGRESTELTEETRLWIKSQLEQFDDNSKHA
jgi:1-acyl-sn-glycerol-3-phosphate acyltransferase